MIVTITFSINFDTSYAGLQTLFFFACAPKIVKDTSVSKTKIDDNNKNKMIAEGKWTIAGNCPVLSLSFRSFLKTEDSVFLGFENQVYKLMMLASSCPMTLSYQKKNKRKNVSLPMLIKRKRFQITTEESI